MIRAPFSGKVIGMAQGLHPQRWLGMELPLATLVSPGKAVVQGIADEEAVAVFAIGQIGRFVPDDVLAGQIDIEVTGNRPYQYS